MYDLWPDDAARGRETWCRHSCCSPLTGVWHHSTACVAAGLRLIFAFWNGVVPALPPRMTAQDASQRQPCPDQSTMFLQGFQRIGAAGWLITTIVPHPWAENQPIGAHGKRKKMCQHAHRFALCSFSSAAPRSAMSESHRALSALVLHTENMSAAQQRR